jgi:signal transduction histidine kinase
MNKTPTSERTGETSVGPEHELGMRAREQAISNRETWARARESVNSEHEIGIHDREEAVALREKALRAREEADTARAERERLLVHMREANEKLVVATLRADALADQAFEAGAAAAEAARVEAEGRQRAEALATRLRASEQALLGSEQDARARDRAKDEFLAMLGHELRNPLAAIQIAIDVIGMDPSDTHRREHAVIERQMQQLVRLVDDLLDAARVRNRKVELDCSPIELADVVARAVEMTRALIESRGHVLDVRVPSRGLMLDGDMIRLTQVVGNLLSNAAKYTPDGGSIVVLGERRDAAVALRVRDTGIGISSEMLPRVFDLFAQEQQALDRTDGGLGLGLTIVRQLVTLHGGTVTAHSDGLGRGSELVIELPAIPTERIARWH